MICWFWWRQQGAKEFLAALVHGDFIGLVDSSIGELQVRIILDDQNQRALLWSRLIRSQKPDRLVGDHALDIFPGQCISSERSRTVQAFGGILIFQTPALQFRFAQVCSIQFDQPFDFPARETVVVLVMGS
jgi:hypothetical protein